MAETLAGGWVRSATTSSASTRPCASPSGVACAGSGAAPASTRASASATGISATISLLRPVVTRLAAALLDQPDALDAYAALHRLHHVVDGEAGDRHRGQRLHLDPGRAGDLHGRAHVEARQRAVWLDVDRDLGHGQ